MLCMSLNVPLAIIKEYKYFEILRALTAVHYKWAVFYVCIKGRRKTIYPQQKS